LVFGEEHAVVAEDGQVGHALPHHAESDLEPLPQVGEVVLARDVPLGASAKAGDGVTLRVEGVAAGHHPPLLGEEQEQDAVHNMQDFGVVLLN